MGKHINRKPLGDHEVGYARTPEHTRFPHQKRTSRRAKAEPRVIATRQFMRDFFSALDTPVAVTRNGKKTRAPASQVIQDQLVAAAAKGAPWAIRRVTDLQLALIREYEHELVEIERAVLELDAIAKRKPLDAETRMVLEELRERISNPRELFRDGVGAGRVG